MPDGCLSIRIGVMDMLGVYIGNAAGIYVQRDQKLDMNRAQ